MKETNNQVVANQNSLSYQNLKQKTLKNQKVMKNGDLQPEHNHQNCSEKVIKNAEEICLRSSLNLTAIRRKVLEIIAVSHKPSRAYELLAKLKEVGFSDKPPTIYRALDFLIENQMVHKINTLNAYVACFNGNLEEVSCFLICENCQEIAEFQDEALRKAVTAIGKRGGFKVKNVNLEIEFRCSKCRDSEVK